MGQYGYNLLGITPLWGFCCWAHPFVISTQLMGTRVNNTASSAHLLTNFSGVVFLFWLSVILCRLEACLVSQQGVEQHNAFVVEKPVEVPVASSWVKSQEGKHRLLASLRQPSGQPRLAAIPVQRLCMAIAVAPTRCYVMIAWNQARRRVLSTETRACWQEPRSHLADRPWGAPHTCAAA